MMGHMDDVVDDNEKKFAVTVYTKEGTELFHGCTEIDASERELGFTDKNQKSHKFYGATYHIAQE